MIVPELGILVGSGAKFALSSSTLLGGAGTSALKLQALLVSRNTQRSRINAAQVELQERSVVRPVGERGP